MAAAPKVLLGKILKEVSRSFYTTLRVLPGQIRPQIGIAYLLARATDTIADTELLPADRRLASLQALRERILGSSSTSLNFAELASSQKLPAERVLLENVEAILELLQTFDVADRKLVQQVLDTITSGQELDLRRFDGASAQRVIALQAAEDLDDYTYRVAGCVGEFWTRICRAKLFPRAPLNDQFLLDNGIRFGKGLQLVNILRDLPADLRTGRCYLPQSQLSADGLEPAQLLDPANESRLRPIYNPWLETCQSHLAAGWAYTNALPRGSVRVRLACAWPILIGLRTVALLRTRNVLDPGQRIKISRPEVKRIIRRSVLLYPFPGAWGRMARISGP